MCVAWYTRNRENLGLKKKKKEMSQEQLDKPITYDVKEEAEKIPATEEKEKGVVADASGEQVHKSIR